MRYTLLVIAFLLLFGYEGQSVITLLDFMGYIALFFGLRMLNKNPNFKLASYFSLGNIVLWLISFYLQFLFTENTSEGVINIIALTYVWLLFIAFMVSIVFTLIGIQTEAHELNIRWLSTMSVIVLIAFLLTESIMHAVVYILEWEVLIPMQLVVIVVNGLLIFTTIFARFNLQKKVVRSS